MPIAHVNGVDLHHLQAGEGDDVLLLCGLGDDVTAWNGQFHPFSERHRVTVVDNRGVGRSSLPDGEFTVRDMASDAAALCDAIGIGPAHVMGFSMGGAIAQELAIARPELIRSLVIVGSWAYSDRLFRTFIESSAYFAGIADDDRAFLMYFLASTYSKAVFEDGRIDAFCDAILNNPYPQSTEAFQRTRSRDPRPRHPRSARSDRRADPRPPRRGGHHLPAAPFAPDRKPHPGREAGGRPRAGPPALPGRPGGLQRDRAAVLVFAVTVGPRGYLAAASVSSSSAQELMQ